MFDTASQALVEAAGERPLLLVLDDVHRADVASIMLLRFILPTLRGASLLLLGTYRDTEVGPAHPLLRMVGEVAGSADVQLIQLHGLTRSDTDHLIRQTGLAMNPEQVELLHRRTGGNPFFLTELLNLPPSQAGNIPATVDAAIHARIHALPVASREVLEVAAVLGRDINVELISALVEQPMPEVLAALTPAVDQRLVALHPGHRGAYRFDHVLVQQSLYRALDPSRRVSLHDRAAVTLDREVGADPAYAASLAYHAVEAIDVPGGQQRAYDTASRAAQVASDRHAAEDAAGWYRKALSHAPVDNNVRVRLLLKLGRTAGQAGRMTEARVAFERAWRMADRLDLPHQLTDAALGLGEVIVSACTVDAGLVRMLERTLARLSSYEVTLRARLTARLATELYWGAGLQRARELADSAVTAARQLDDPRTLAVTLAAYQFVMRGPDKLTERIDAGEELLDLAARLNDEALELHARRILIPDRLQYDPVAAEDELTQLEALAEESGRPLARWYVLLNRAVRAAMVGDLDNGWTLVDQAEALGQRIEVQPATIYSTAQRFALLRQKRRVREAEDSLRHQAARWPVLVTFRCQLTLLLADTGRREEATALLDELVPDGCAALPPDSLWLANVSMLAEAAASLEHKVHAEALNRLLRPYTGRIAMQGVVVWWGSVDYYLALTATILTRWDEAEAGFRAALRLHQTWGAVPFATATLNAYADMLRRRGGPGDRLHATQLTTRTSKPTSTGPSQSALTLREHEVLNQLACGASNKEIAGSLKLSVHTVERHIANIYAKIGARNRAEATAYALNHLVTTAPGGAGQQHRNRRVGQR
ncbi:MAG: hypothetical protein JO296_20460 [Pseudonocardiales bacterium]|nr:hypothetical protein [Pseudonocardiales bacterium]